MLIQVIKNPTLTTTSLSNAEKGKEYSETITANDVDGDNSKIIFQLTAAPSWLSITNNNNGTATLSSIGLVPADASNPTSITVKITDEHGGEITRNLTISVVEFANSLPTFTTDSTLTPGVKDSTYYAEIEFTDVDGDPLILTPGEGFPSDWLNLTMGDLETRDGVSYRKAIIDTIEIIPSDVDVTTFTLNITDNVGETPVVVSKEFTINIYEPLAFTIEASDGSQPDRISSNTIDPLEDRDFSFNKIIVTGGKTDDIVVTFSSINDFGPYESFSHTKGERTATLNWTPQVPWSSWINPPYDLDPLKWTITVSDGIQTITENYNVYVQFTNSPTTGSFELSYTSPLNKDDSIGIRKGTITDDDTPLTFNNYKFQFIDSEGNVNREEITGDSIGYTIRSTDIGYKIRGWGRVTDYDPTGSGGAESTIVFSNTSIMVEPRFRILDIGAIISDPPLIGKSFLTYGYEDPSESENIRNIRFQWQKKFPAEVSWTNIDQTDTTDSLLLSNFEDCSGQIIRLKITYDTAGGFTDIIGYTPVTQIVQDNRPKITGIELMEGDTQIEGTNYYIKNELNNISLKVTFDINVQVVTLVEDQKPDINIQIGGQGNEPTSTSNETDKDNFSTQHKTSLYLETRLIGPDTDGKWKTTPHTELTFRMPRADDLGISNPVGLLELWGSSYHIETDPALRRDDRLMSLGLEGSHIKSSSANSYKNDLHAIIKLPNLFSEIIPSVSINVFTEPSITLTADPNNGRGWKNNTTRNINNSNQ